MVDSVVDSKNKERVAWMKALGRVAVVVAVLAAVLAAGGYLWLRAAARAAMPQLDGTVKVAGLRAAVTVVRDEHGVPSITAETLQDLFFAQGYVTAQDRLWQMDMMRRYAAGELAAALGKDYVKLDQQQRVLGLREAARHSLEQASPEVRAQLDDYARGVNAYINEHQYGLPLEMRVLRYFPRAWTAEDSLLVGISMAEMLNHGTFLDDLNHARILERLGPELTGDLYVERSQRDIVPGHDLDEVEPVVKEQGFKMQGFKVSKFQSFKVRSKGRSKGNSHGPEKQGFKVSRFQGFKVRGKGRSSKGNSHSLKARLPEESMGAAGGIDPHLLKVADVGHLQLGQLGQVEAGINGEEMDRTRAGSNNWVISGAHTGSGRPLLSNDMHLPHQIPNTWYEAHLTCGDFDVAGVTLPGTPWVIVGHNRRIAWGFTNLGPDVEDVFVENFNAAGEYRTPEGWRKPEVRHEVIRVKRGRDVEMDVLLTRHGPIISDEMRGASSGASGAAPGMGGRPALKWEIYDTGLSLPFFAMDSARNWEEFRAALGQFNGPGQNVVYADVDGNIGYQATGRVPVRAAGDGTLPVSGADDAHEWTGTIPFEEMPSVYNPPSGIIATANGRVTPDGYKYSITKQWESPYRTERIYQVLRQEKKFTEADMLALQMDVESELDRFVTQRMVYAVDQSPGASARARSGAEILRRFDGKLSTASAGAAIEQKARQWLERTLLKSKLGEDAELYRWFMKTVWLENAIAFQPARWLPQEYKSWDALLTAAVEAAVNDPQAPKELAEWKYGDYSTVQIAHPIFGRLPWLKKFAATEKLPQSGNGITVKQVGGKFAPSERFTADLAELDRSTLNIVNGESGNLFSPYFNDQFAAWYGGSTFGLAFKPETVERTAVHRLRLVGD